MDLQEFINRKDNRIDLILGVAEESFLRNGYKKTTIEDVANNAGISKPIIYRYFKNKEDLYLGVMIKNIFFFIEKYDEIENKHDSSEEKLYLYIDLLFEAISENKIIRESTNTEEDFAKIWLKSSASKEIIHCLVLKLESIIKTGRQNKEWGSDLELSEYAYLLYQSIIGLFTKNISLFKEEQRNLFQIKENIKCIFLKIIK